MIILITHDDQLKPICNVWNAIHQDSPFYEEVSLGSGEKLRSIYILVSIPVLEHRNLSISPQIFKFDGLFDIQIPFRFPKDIDAYPDLSPVLNALTSSISDHLTVYTNIKPLQRYRVELYMNVRNEYLIGMLGSRTDSAHKYLTFNERKLLMEVTLNGKLQENIQPDDKVASTDEIASHVAVNARLTGYHFITPIEETIVTTLSFFIMNYPSHSEMPLAFTYQLLNKSRVLSTQHTYSNRFFSFLKHASSSSTKLPYFQKGTLKDLNRQQLDAIKGKIGINIEKNYVIKISFIQMIIIHFYLEVKRSISPSDFTKIIREHRIDLKTHREIIVNTYNCLPTTVLNVLDSTLDRESGVNDLDIEEVIPELLIIDFEQFAENVQNETQKYKERIAELSRLYGRKDTLNALKKPKRIIDYYDDLLKDDQYANTIFTNHLIDAKYGKAISQFEKTKERIMAASKFLVEFKDKYYELLDLKKSEMGENYISDSALDENTDPYGALTAESRKKLDDTNDKIKDIIETAYDVYFKPSDDESHFQSNQEELTFNDDWERSYLERVKTRLEDGKGAEMNENKKHLLIYVIIGYYFNLHSTAKLLWMADQIPQLDDKLNKFPLKECFPLTFNKSFNAFKSKHTSFTQNDYDDFDYYVKFLTKIVN